MFCRMAFTPASYAVKRFCRSERVALASSLRTPDRRNGSLPLSSPFRMSRKVPVSLPSRNATSGSISSDDTSEFAFFAIRCESMASWLVKSISRTLPPPAAACEEAC